MKLILFVAIICTAVLVETEAAVARGIACPSACERCDNRAVGESWQGHNPSSCMRVTCTKERNSVSIAGVGCGSFGLPRGSKCTIVKGNPKARYPGCCPRPVCPE